jgi:translation initiation factor 4A
MAVPPGGGLGIIGSGRSASTAESAQAREWKLDALADLFDDVEVTQAIVHVGGVASLDSVVYKLASRGLEAVPLVRMGHTELKFIANDGLFSMVT